MMKLGLTAVFSGLFTIAAALPAWAQGPFVLDPAKLKLASANALVVDAIDNRAVYTKAADDVTPIASLTKLMTAIVTLEAAQPMDEPLAIDMDDFDFVKGSHSRLRMGSELPRREMLRLALMSSENRAASSLRAIRRFALLWPTEGGPSPICSQGLSPVPVLMAQGNFLGFSTI